MLGSGFQDVDISRRITKQANIVRRDAKQGAVSPLIPADIADGIDDALPNHASNDWSLNCHAKVLNIDKDDFRKAGGDSWNDVNQHYLRVMKAKISPTISYETEFVAVTSNTLLFAWTRKLVTGGLRPFLPRPRSRRAAASCSATGAASCSASRRLSPGKSCEGD